MQLMLDRCFGVEVRSHARGGSQVVGCCFNELGVKWVHTFEQIILVQRDILVHQLRQSLRYQPNVLFQATQIYAGIAKHVWGRLVACWSFAAHCLCWSVKTCCGTVIRAPSMPPTGLTCDRRGWKTGTPRLEKICWKLWQQWRAATQMPGAPNPSAQGRRCWFYCAPASKRFPNLCMIS